MSLGIILPRRTIEYRCMCGKEFADKAKGIKHAIACADKHQDEIEELEASPVRDFRRPLDPEALEWGRKRIAEGKIGFKRGRPA